MTHAVGKKIRDNNHGEAVKIYPKLVSYLFVDSINIENWLMMIKMMKKICKKKSISMRSIKVILKLICLFFTYQKKTVLSIHEMAQTE